MSTVTSIIIADGLHLLLNLPGLVFPEADAPFIKNKNVYKSNIFQVQKLQLNTSQQAIPEPCIPHRIYSAHKL